MVAQVTTYMGWNLEQWGEAVAWFARVYGFTPLPDHDGALTVQYRWLMKKNCEPGSPRLILLTECSWTEKHYLDRCNEKNSAWAVRMFCKGGMR